MKSRLSRNLRKRLLHRAHGASRLCRSRKLRLENLETRNLLTGIPTLDAMGPVDGGPEGEATGPAFVPDQLIVRFAAGTTNQQRDHVLQQEGASLLQTFYGLDYVVVKLPGDGVSSPDGMNTLVNRWEARPEVTYASPNRYLFTTNAIPNDPLIGFQWAYNNYGQSGGLPDADIDAFEGWDVRTSASDVVVAIIDTGVDYNHPDLVNNMWRNPGEIPGNSIDDDGNGYVDDVYGIAPASSITPTDPIDFGGHGTHVAGTVGADGNNGIGVAGVAWDVQLMAVNILEGDIGGTEVAAAAGISYVTMMREQHGINVLVSNNSWGGDVDSQLIRAAIADHIDAGILFVAAAGNDDRNTDITPAYPASFNLPGILSVGSTNHLDQRSSFSNYGRVTVDLFAPGGDGAAGDAEAIYSTWPPGVADSAGVIGSLYDGIQGTSMASPHVAGAAALIRSMAPEMSVLETKQLLMDTVDRLPWLTGLAVSPGRLNLATALGSIFSTRVEGTVWSDRNGNGVRDTGDNGVANWTVYVDLNRNGVMDATEPSDTTSADGSYSIATYAAPGQYVVRQVVQPNWTPTFPATGTHTITIVNRGDVITGRDFGNKPAPGSVTGVKYHDLDGSGSRDPGEPGRAGVWIYADLNNDGKISLMEPAAITAADGSYSIHNIPGGNVVIREVLPLGWATSEPALGYHPVTITPAQTVTGINFGNVASFDYGDAPAPYATLKAQGGAYHGVTPGYQLGALIDAESDGIPSSNASGDDLDNLADEDGIIIDGPLLQGSTGSLQATVQISSYPIGYLQGWIDFNGDGDWNDAGEQIIQNNRVGTGTHTISFAVPDAASVIVGQTFARFRYGMERDLGPTGASTAGEVEDYAVLVLKDEPVANPDMFEVDQDSGANDLDVLANDFPSSTGVLFVSTVGAASHGTTSRGAGNMSVIYQPNDGFSGEDTFTYTVSDGSRTDTATVTVIVNPTLFEPVAVDDLYRVSAASGSETLDVLVNDLPGILGDLDTLTITTAPSWGTAVVDDKGTASALDDVIIYTPDGDAGFRIDQFEYTIGNANGTSMATVTILEDPAPADLKVDLSIELQDLLGRPITSIALGEQFQMVVSVQDVRSTVTSANRGMYAAYLDVLYDRTLVSPVTDLGNRLGFDITFGNNYLNGAVGDASTPGILDEVGAFQTSTTSPLGGGQLELFRVTFAANAAGSLEFLADPADISPLHDTLYFNPPSVAALGDINYGIAGLTITDGSGGTGSGGEGELVFDVNADGYVSPMDALLVITNLNTNGGSSKYSASSASVYNANSRLDVNRDTHISPLDVLLVVSYLNRGEGEGEGMGAEGESDVVATVTPTSVVESDTLGDPSALYVVLDSDSDAAPAVTKSVTSSSAVTTDSADDWQTRVGEAESQSTLIDPAEVATQSWESLLDTLAEDVLQSWLDGEDA